MAKRISAIIATILITISAFSQIATPIRWETQIKTINDSDAEIIFNATIQDGWHLYSTKLPDVGITATNIEYSTLTGVKLIGELSSNATTTTTVYDNNFQADLSWWSNQVTLSQTIQILSPDYSIAGEITFMACNDNACTPPSKQGFSFGTPQIATTDNSFTTFNFGTAPTDNSTANKYWQPVNATENSTTENPTNIKGLLYILLGGFLGGLLALLTPCVWPMIPLTVSFFLKSSKSKSKSISDAILYGVSIIVIYLLIGLSITMIFGASSLNALSTNAIFNIIFFLLLVVFAISFFGAFDIKLPDSWSNAMDSRAEKTTGLISIFFMAFTLALVSFSCTGPIIGTLLVQAASMGSILAPAIGMFGFAAALALPFTLFAIFPSWLKELPRSGGWLNSVKVVLGFIELALSLKFLSVADLAYGWGILDREIFISLWVVIFALLGAYLLGLIRFSGDGKSESVGIVKLFAAIISLSFSVYLIPGLWGAPLKGVSAFLPPIYTQDFNINGNTTLTEYHDYEQGMEVAAREGQPVLVDFSGYGCVNCRKMEAAVIDSDQIKDKIANNLVMIKLMVDDKRELPEAMQVTENGRNVTLRTYGDKWSYLQRYKFRANSQPYYVILNNSGELISGPTYYDENINNFMKFLDKGIANY
ncbi:MAG: cytochrome c biogenesis protein CcdA [Bacteroidales bacterium]